MKTLAAPALRLEEEQGPGDILLNFYRDLGWDGEKYVNPIKIKTTEEVYNSITDMMSEVLGEYTVQIGFFMVNSGPSVSADVPDGKVRLYEGWLEEAEVYA